jgi:hypothetical protein
MTTNIGYLFSASYLSLLFGIIFLACARIKFIRQYKNWELIFDIVFGMIFLCTSIVILIISFVKLGNI